ncbi:MAG: NifB/NifX family molybdenum-iron cluster-binding protein, partial [Phycisphaerae bacterium]
FVNRYCPTPIVVPWSGSDFFGLHELLAPAGRLEIAKQSKTPSSTEVIRSFAATRSDRLDLYRRTIVKTISVMEAMDLVKKEQLNDKKFKAAFIATLRSSLPDPAVGWIDTCAVLDSDKAAFNSLMGSGGGQRLAEESNVPFLGRIPFDPAVVISGDAGSPFVQSGEQGPAARAFAAAVQPLLDDNQDKPGPAAEAALKEKQTMKIAIPVAEGRLCMHFGHCQQFAIVEADEAGREITNVEFLTPPPHEPGVLPRWLHEQGAGVIIAGGMGQRAQGLFAANGITVVVGAPADAPQDVAAAYLAGRLETGQNVCDH